MQKRSTYGLRLDQMESLFSIGADEPGPADAKGDSVKMADLVRRQLTCALPERSLLFDALLMMMNQQGCDTRPLAGKSLSDVLLDSQSDVGLLRSIKDCSKQLSRTLDSEAETALATTVYFAALAGALVHHDAKISQNPYETLDESFAMLIEKTWMTPELVELFGRARRICGSRRGEK